ncbi:MAG: hypothetical protein JNL67_10465 [Planctomycetaceae bacterium]|nr:hypothetical protein [Planctomycetaceae bacterium]
MASNSDKSFLVPLLAAFVLLALIAGYVWFNSGAGPEMPPNSVHVAGEVKWQGQPLKLGLIVFEPDATKGGKGVQGYAQITEGKFDTKNEGVAAPIGPCLVRITGGDGVAVDGFAPFGKLLFDEYSQTLEVGESTSPLSIEVKAAPYKEPDPEQDLG